MLTNTNLNFEQAIQSSRSQSVTGFDYYWFLDLSPYSLSTEKIKILARVMGERKTHISFLKLDMATIEKEAIGSLQKLVNAVASCMNVNSFRIKLCGYGLLNDNTEAQTKENIHDFVNGISLNIALVLDFQGKLYTILKSTVFDAEKTFSKIITIFNSYDRVTGLNFSYNNLGAISKPSIEAFQKALLNSKELVSLEMTHCQMNQWEPKILENFMVSLLSNLPLDQFKLCFNRLWNVDTEVLKVIATAAEKKGKLNGFELYENSETDVMTMQSWSRERQKHFLEIQIQLRQKNYSSDALIINALTVEDVKEILATYIKKHPDNSEYRINTWLSPFPQFADLAAYLQAGAVLLGFKASIEKLDPGQKIGLNLNLSKITDNEMACSLKEEIKNKKTCLSQLNLQIILHDQTADQLQYLTKYINELVLPEGSDLYLSQQGVMVGSSITKEFSFLINQINNKSIRRLNFQYNDLGSIEPSELDRFIDYVKSIEQFSYISLVGTNFDRLGEERIIKYISTLQKNRKIQFLDFSRNNLEKFGPDFLVKLNNLIALDSHKQSSSNNNHELLQAKKTNLIFFDYYADDFLLFLNTVEDPKIKFELAKIHLISYYLMESSYYSDERELPEIFSTKENYQIIQELMSLEGGLEEVPYRLMRMIESYRLDSVDRVELIRSCIKRDREALYGFGPLKKLDIVLEDRVALFLEIAQMEPLFFYAIDDFKIYKGEQPVNKILSSMEGVIKESSPDDAPDDESDTDDENEDIIAERILEIGILRLQAACKQYLPSLPFVELCLKSIALHEEHKEDDSVYPFFRMVAWLTWSCATLATMPKLIKILENKGEFPKIDEEKSKKVLKIDKKKPKEELRDYMVTFNDIMKQILDFANPKMRYALTSAFFDKICLDENKTYFSIVKKSSLEGLLPAIPLCEIVLQETDEALREGYLKWIKGTDKEEGLLSLLSGSQSLFQGRFYRSMVAGLCAISADNKLKPLGKLGLIQKIMDRSKERKEIEVVLEEFILLCKIEDNEHTEKELENFSSSIQKISPVLAKSIDLRTYKKNISEKKSNLKLRVGKFEKIEGEISNLVVECDKVGENKSEKLIENYVKSLGKEDKFLIEKWFKKLIKNRIYSDKNKLKLILENLQAEKSTIMKGINKEYRAFQRNLIDEVVAMYYKKLEFSQQVSSFMMVQGLANMGRLSELSEVGKENFNTSARKIFQELFSLNSEQLKFYDETFAKCWNETALLTYYSKIKTLKGEGADKLMTLFKTFVQTVLSPGSADFYKMRYDKGLNLHLAKVFSGRSQLEAGWKKELEVDLNQFIEKSDIIYQEYKPNFEGFIRNKIFGHQHIDPKYYGSLKAYLEAKSDDEKKSIKEKIEISLVECKQQKTKEKQSVISLDEKHAKIQCQLLNLLELPINLEGDPRKKYDNHLKILGKISAILTKPPIIKDNQFQHDIEVLIKGLESNRKPLKTVDLTDWKIIKTGHYWRVFMSGTDVEGSCQNVDGDAFHNKCLPAYVMNGYIMMVAILNAESKTYARCMVKLLWDEKNQTPGVFLEGAYPDSLRPDFQEALIKFVISWTKDLNLSVGTLENLPLSENFKEESGLIVNNELSDGEGKITWECRGGVAPYEYEDALFSIMEGEYTIPGIQILYRPEVNYRVEEAASDNLIEATNQVLFHFSKTSKEEGLEIKNDLNNNNNNKSTVGFGATTGFDTAFRNYQASQILLPPSPETDKQKLKADSTLK